MEKISQDTNLICQKHKKKRIEFIQVNDTQNQDQNKPLFYCAYCMFEDKSFDNENYFVFDDIIDEGHKNIMKQWPPVNDYQVIENLSNLHSSKSEAIETEAEREIISFFDKLRNDIHFQLQKLQKQLIEQTKDNLFSKQKLIEKYQQISNIIPLRKLLFNSEQLSNEQLQESYKQFLQQMEQEKELKTQELQDLLHETENLAENIYFDQANQIKQQILSLINQITFLKQNVQQEANHSQRMNETIFNLISNKTNYCSNEFLVSFKEQLQLFNSSNLLPVSDKIFQQNQNPIDFSKLNDQKLNLIKQYVNHSIDLLKKQLYPNQVKNSAQITSFLKLIDPNQDLFEEESKQELEKFLVDVFPFFQKMNLKVKDKNYKNILPLINFKQSKPYNLVISKNENGSYNISSKSKEAAYYCYSDLILDVSNKYSFKFQINISQPNNFVFIGLAKLDTLEYTFNHPVLDNYSFILTYENSSIVKHTSCGIDTLTNEIPFEFKSEELIVEFIVDLENKIIQVSDFPDKKSTLMIQEELKNQLNLEKNLVLYTSVRGEHSQCTLLEAIQTNQKNQ